MRKSWMLLLAFVLVMLVAVTPALAAGGRNQNGHQNQEENQNQEQSQSQEQNQEQSQSQEQNQNQEQNGQRHGAGQQTAPMAGKQLFTLTGTITALDTGVITVIVHDGNRFVKPYVGLDLPVQVTGDTVYRVYTPDGCVPIGFDDLEVGDTASVQGSVIDEGFIARRVTVDVPCCTP